MSIHYRQYTDTFSILNYLQDNRLSCLWRKKLSKVGPLLSRKSKLPTKSSFVEKKTVTIGTIYIIKKIIERSILASHVQCLLQKRTSHWVAGVFNAIQHRDAKGKKVSGNFGNFPWKVSGVLKGWEFSEIFNFDLFSTFYEIVCTKINKTEFSLHYIQTYLFCTTFLTVRWFVWVHRKNHMALLWKNIRSNLLGFHKIKYFMLFHVIFRISKETPDSKKKKK